MPIQFYNSYFQVLASIQSWIFDYLSFIWFVSFLSRFPLVWKSVRDVVFKRPLVGLRQFLADAFHFIWKALFILKIFKVLPWLFGHAGKQLDKKAKVNFKIYDVTYWETNDYNKHIAQIHNMEIYLYDVRK